MGIFQRANGSGPMLLNETGWAEDRLEQTERNIFEAKRNERPARNARYDWWNSQKRSFVYTCGNKACVEPGKTHKTDYEE
jgi:hypothetical protein